jgi:hypothetical protein
MQVDGQFQALSEYLLTFPRGYCSSHDPSKILIGKMVRKTSVWESDNEGTSIPLDIFFSSSTEFHALLNGIITFPKMSF